MVAFDTCHVFVACEFLAEEHDGGPVQSKLEPSCSCPCPNLQIRFECGDHESALSNDSLIYFQNLPFAGQNPQWLLPYVTDSNISSSGQHSPREGEWEWSANAWLPLK